MSQVQSFLVRLSVLWLAVVPVAAAQVVVHVDGNAQIGGDGVTWNTAFKYLQDALYAAQAGDSIRLAGGVYKPDHDEAGLVEPGDREATFELVDGVHISGGYAGLADPADPDARDLDLYETQLSGDLNGDDGPCFLGIDENVYTIVTAEAVNETTVLDGLTIIGGNADDGAGAGMHNSYSSPTLVHCTFSGNTAEYGAGMFNGNRCHPTLTHCRFVDNSAEHGGAMRNQNGASPTLVGCVFLRNTASIGGGINNWDRSSPAVVDCTFDENFVSRGGGGIYNGDGSDPLIDGCVFTGNVARVDGGGVYNISSAPVVQNCVFHRNAAYGNTPAALEGNGGGMMTYDGTPTAINCVFTHNWAEDGGGMFNFSGSLTVVNCVLWENTPDVDQVFNFIGSLDVSYSCVQNGSSAPWFGPDCIDEDPQFVELGFWDDGGTPFDAGDDSWLDGDMRLTAGSPCIDAGDVRHEIEPGETDADGHARVLCGRVDIGAFEFGIGDYDCSGGVDLYDFYHLQACYTGSGAYAYDEGCVSVDFDYDGDVDLSDHLGFYRTIGGG